ncbi:unnamed protein product [Moneuplotes crassus]|uniref:Uncharacterized protein n=1 Tax=Euplotes crassus TaxID=5936 RepID=A0AAD1XUI7_EUPCR|nr:unnamed protein product [Moneuplotes crassus]
MEYSESQITYKLKIIMLGDSSVGKTSMSQMIENPDQEYISVDSTVGFEYISKVYECDGDLVQVHLWDTAGQDKYGSLSDQYFKRAAGAFIIFDISSKKSFESCKGWHSQLKEAGENSVEVVLIGNKVDLEDEREVTFKEAQEFAKEHSFSYIETSVMMNKNIMEAFQLLINRLIASLKKLEKNTISSSSQQYMSPGPQRREYSSSIVLRKKAELLDSRNRGMKSSNCKC